MLITAKKLECYKLDSLDGEIAGVKEFYFDDQHWIIRYLVAETGTWLADRQVLISPYAIDAVNPDEKTIDINLTKKQIEESPSVDSHKPVSHQFEEAIYTHFGYPPYWSGPYSWGDYPIPIRDPELWKKHSEDKKEWDPHF